MRALFLAVLLFSSNALAQDQETKSQDQETKPEQEDPKLGNPGESCRASADCKRGLKCVAGACHDEHEGESCNSTFDCGGTLRCVQNVCGGPKPGEAPEPKEMPWQSQGIGIYYLMTPPVAGPLKSAEVGHSVGIESSSRLFAQLRMRNTFGYQAAPGAGTIAHGLRGELMSLGYRIDMVKAKSVKLAFEPQINVLNLETYFGSGAGLFPGSAFIFSSGFGLGAILGFGDGHGYVSLEPVGFDFRWLLAGDGLKTTADIGVQWRMRFSIGLAW